MRDITKRFVIVYNNWPCESFDDQASAKTRMQEMIANQTQSLTGIFPNHGWDVRPLWKVTDVLGAAARKVRLWRRFWLAVKRLLGQTD